MDVAHTNSVACRGDVSLVTLMRNGDHCVLTRCISISKYLPEKQGGMKSGPGLGREGRGVPGEVGGEQVGVQGGGGGGGVGYGEGCGGQQVPRLRRIIRDRE